MTYGAQVKSFVFDQNISSLYTVIETGEACRGPDHSVGEMVERVWRNSFLDCLYFLSRMRLDEKLSDSKKE